MAQDQTIIVTIPGVGDVEFPTSMSMTEISQAAAQLHNEAVLQDPARHPARAEDFAPERPAQTGMAGVANYARNLAQNVLPSTTPSDYVYGPLYTARHPLESLDLLLSAIGRAHADQASKTADSARRILHEPTLAGKTAAVSETLGHGLATVVPLVGPNAARGGEQIASGDVTGGMGTIIGLLTAVLGPRAVQQAVAGARVPGVGPNPNPVQADAVAFGERAGVPIDAATATGRPIVRRIQKRLGDTLGGSGVTERFQRDQSAALTTTGRRLAEQADPSGPSSPELAGQAMQDGVRGQIAGHRAEANAAYDRLRTIAEEHPETVTTQEPTPAPADAPGRFTMKRAAMPDDVFAAAYEDARQNGYTGTKEALRAKFDEGLASGMRGLEERAAIEKEYGPEGLLKAIRQKGGLRPFTKDLRGTKLRGDFASIVESFKSKGGWGKRAQGVFRDTGLALDDLLQQLHQDPRWRAIIADENELVDALDEIARDGPSKTGKPTVEDALAISDVRPGAKWWVPRVTQQQALPVDLRPVRPLLQPIYDRLLRERDLTPATMMGDKAKALQALDALMQGQDFAPLDIADKALSNLKRMSRGPASRLPELRTEGQGVAAKAVQALETQVQQAVASAGPEAMDALEAGRHATKAKYAAGDVLKALRKEPVQAFNQATYARDAGIQQLRKVAALAPDAMRKVGRAYLDDLIDKATVGGRFDKSRSLLSAWENLGPETKRLLFRDPAYIRDLDNFFRLAELVNENPNPSGTAGQLTATNVASAIPFKIASHMLYSRRGIQTLINGFRVRLPRGRVAAPASAFRPRSVPAPPVQAPGIARDQSRRPDQQASAAPGQVLSGNIDLTRRPRVTNADGSVSTVRSMSFNEDGREILIPTVSEEGRILSNAEAIAQYHRTGKHLGVFTTAAAATAYARKLHDQYAAGAYGPLR